MSKHSTVAPAELCPRCGGTRRNGICVNCLLREGLHGAGEGSAEVFETVLAEAKIPDTAWRLGNYEILDEIGRGGMGVIYRARQRHSRRIVALKRVLANQSDSRETLVRFRREAEAAAKLDHPNILPVYEVGESADGLPFFSMKFAAGGSLRQAMTRLRERPKECVRLMAEVARAIDHAHEQGVLHRDLQPGNILLDAHGEPLVSDFGLAKWLLEDSDLTRTLTTFGTPGYIAPEQAESGAGELSRAADVYSLGAVLFHLLSGRPPFIGTNVLSVIRQAATNPAPRLRSLVPQLDRDLETICGRCLEREASARYQSAGELAEDLERWLEGRAIVARPVSVLTQTWRWSRRNPGWAITALTCLSLGVSIVWLLWQREDASSKIAAPEKSIAVLPFENLSENREEAQFASGVQDEILTDLARIADLKVISRTSTRAYRADQPRNSREIGRQLGVAHLLEGSVERARNHVRIHAQLIDARTDTHLWAETYDRELADVFAIQSEIAQTIANQLQVRISDKEKASISKPATRDLLANDLYQQAIGLPAADARVTYDDPGTSITLLEKAIARDPQFVRAYCALARAHLRVYDDSDHTPSRLHKAESNIAKAAELQPDSGEVHLVRAHYLARAIGDYDSARAELELARRALPNDSGVYDESALLDRRQGRWSEALRNFDRAIELDPRNLQILDDAAFSYSMVKRYPEAIGLAQRILTLAPHDRGARLFIADQRLDEQGDLRPLRAEIEAILAGDPKAGRAMFEHLWTCAILRRDPAEADRALAIVPAEGYHIWWGSVLPREWLAGCAARLFKQPEAARTDFLAAREQVEKHLRQHPQDGLTWSLLGRIEAMLGEKQQAIEAANRACELWPLSREPTRGMRPFHERVLTYAWVGEKDRALQDLAAHATEPTFVTYGELKLHPDWDPLRGDPRFEKLLASLAPKEERSKH
jgi:serine/threonine protein kinase/Tfp pilus assembly protein PilF